MDLLFIQDQCEESWFTRCLRLGIHYKSYKENINSPFVELIDCEVSGPFEFPNYIKIISE